MPSSRPSGGSTTAERPRRPAETVWQPLDSTAQTVAVAVLRDGPIARADLARRLQLSTPSLTRIVRQLMETGVVVELAPTQIARTGRPSLPITVDADRAWFLGIKVLPDRLLTVVCDLSGAIRTTLTRLLPDSGVDTVVETIAEVVADQRELHPHIAGLGIALAAVVEQGRTIRSAVFLGWDEVNLADRLTAATGLPTVLANDVRAFTLSEHWFGEGRGAESFVVITVGAGVGAGAVVNDRLVNGLHGRSGMVGHEIVDPGGRPCYEGHQGCAYQTLSDQALTARFAEVLDEPIVLTDAIALADTDPRIAEVLDHASRCLGRLAGTVANLVDPERILLSGESVGWVRRAAFDQGLAESSYDGVAVVPVVIQQIEMTEWARGAAAGAIVRHVLS